MHDMRKKALIESRKTTSRKARNRPDSLAGSAKSTPKGGSHNSSRHASRHASAVNSRAGSRYASEDEGDDELSNTDFARLHGLRLQEPTRYRRGRDEEDEAEDNDSDADSDDASELVNSEELSNNADVWRFHFQDVLTTLEDRKRSNLRERTNALSKYGRLLRTIYAGDSVVDALPAILEQLLKSIRRSSSGDSEEKKLALEDLAVTALSCSNDSDAADIFDETFAAVKRVIQDPDAIETDKSAAIQALGMVVLLGSGIRSTTDELLNFLLDIVETDGESVASLDSATVVAGATRMWTFAASFMVAALDEETSDDEDYDDEGHDADVEEEDDEKTKPDSHGSERGEAEEDDDGGEDEGDNDDSDEDPELEDYFSSQSQRALEAFIDQLDSTSIDVQIDAGVAIALLYEASRKYEAVQGRPLQLQDDPVELANRMQSLAQGSRSSKSVARQVRRQLRENFRSIATSLELGTGPSFTTAGLPKHRSENPGTTGKYVYDSDDEFASVAPGADFDYEVGDNSGAVEAFGHRKRLAVADRTMTIDTWVKSVRVDMLRAMLGSGLRVHLLRNPRVGRILQAKRLKRLQSAAEREQRKKTAKEKATRKKAKGKNKK